MIEELVGFEQGIQLKSLKYLNTKLLCSSCGKLQAVVDEVKGSNEVVLECGHQRPLALPSKNATAKPAKKKSKAKAA
jgi:hypothetical protein